MDWTYPIRKVMNVKFPTMDQPFDMDLFRNNQYEKQLHAGSIAVLTKEVDSGQAADIFMSLVSQPYTDHPGMSALPSLLLFRNSLDIIFDRIRNLGQEAMVGFYKLYNGCSEYMDMENSEGTAKVCYEDLNRSQKITYTKMLNIIQRSGSRVKMVYSVIKKLDIKTYMALYDFDVPGNMVVHEYAQALTLKLGELLRGVHSDMQFYSCILKDFQRAFNKVFEHEPDASLCRFATILPYTGMTNIPLQSYIDQPCWNNLFCTVQHNPYTVSIKDIKHLHFMARLAQVGGERNERLITCYEVLEQWFDRIGVEYGDFKICSPWMGGVQFSPGLRAKWETLPNVFELVKNQEVNVRDEIRMLNELRVVNDLPFSVKQQQMTRPIYQKVQDFLCEIREQHPEVDEKNTP